MKQLITAVALAGGAAAVGVVLTVQTNPMAFTTPTMEPARAAPATLTLDEVDVVATPPAANEQTDVVADLKRVVRRATAASFPTEPVLERAREASKAALPAAMPATPPPAPQVQEASEPAVTVVSAPCNDGEYRKLDEQRGVRLMCFGE